VGRRIRARNGCGRTRVKSGARPLRTPPHGAEGLPSYFPGARVRRGIRWIAAPGGQVDTGDIIDAR
jgi:hypothetical protein